MSVNSLPLLSLQQKIIKCRKCPRLVKYLKEIKIKYPHCLCKPVPSFGDSKAEVLIVGLAPGRFGSNRTGRMFTGDASGEFLYSTLYETGFSNKSRAVDLNDGLILNNCYITAVARCAPPQNKPTPQELETCFPYFVSELQFLKKVKVVVALGKVAFDSYLKWLFNFYVSCQLSDVSKRDFKFFHGAVYDYNAMPHVLIASYHPSRQNTQTGKLTKNMFRDIFLKAKKYIN